MNHALDALRYLIFKLDAKRLARKKWFGSGIKRTRRAPRRTRTGRERGTRPRGVVERCGMGGVVEEVVRFIDPD